jgi:hypothetical protein
MTDYILFPRAIDLVYYIADRIGSDYALADAVYEDLSFEEYIDFIAVGSQVGFRLPTNLDLLAAVEQTLQRQQDIAEAQIAWSLENDPLNG